MLRLPLIPFTTSKQAALDFIYPDGFATAGIAQRPILAGTNQDVDDWNNEIQATNIPMPDDIDDIVEREYQSRDQFMEVDDPHNYIAAMLTEAVLNRYKSNQVPHHKLKLKKGDICIVLRTLQLKENVATNTRVRIVKLGERIIRVQVLNTNTFVLIPRIRFKCKIR